MLYFELLKDTIERLPDKAAFIAEGEKITFSELDKEAAKIYRFLKEKGIGAEQVVQILMPKRTHFFSCMLGVWRAGAAFVLVQDDYPKERISFIKEDAGCVLVLDQKLFDEIMETTEPLDGFEEPDPHQLAYIVYTSGSTGTPKGILHEYGNVDRCVSSRPTAKEKDETPDERPLTGPLSFVHSILNLVYNTIDGVTTLLETEEKLKDFNYFRDFILKKKLTSFYLPPSYIRLYTDPSPYLKVIGTGSEPANGLYYPGGVPAIRNTYSCSEAGFAVMSCILDKAYDVAPIGRPMPGVEAVLMDEDDQVVEGAGQGELCFKNDFFRGYLNQPELTKRAKRGGYFHTADICRRDERGLYYIVGRADDMIKINGNRIEPAEIEAALQKCTGLSKVVAKGFEEKDRSFVAAYFLEGEAKELKILDGKRLTADLGAMREILPSYMIPTYYVPVSEFPLTASGKIERKRLAAPRKEDFMEEYAAPESEAEKILCDAFAKVLEVERVGATDDFFILGGDSMRTIRLVSECKGFFLSSKLVYQYRTPREIAKHAKGKASLAEFAAKNKAALEKDWPLLPAQKQVLMNQLECPGSGAAIIGTMLELPPDVDAEQMKKALNTVLKAHPALHTRIFKNAQGEYRQKFEPAFFTPVEVVETEDDFKTYMMHQKPEYDVFDKKLYGCGLARCKDGTFLFLAINHLIVEGSTINILMKDIFRLYKEPDAKIPPDGYFGLLADMTQLRDEEGFKEAEKFFSGLFDEKQKAGALPGLKLDHESNVRTTASLDFEKAFEIKHERDGVFFMTAVLLSIAWYNGSDFSYLTSVYNDRDDPVRMMSVGFMASALTFGLDIERCREPKEMLEEIRTQNTFSICHTEYSYALEKELDTRNMVQFNFYKGMQQWKKEGGLAGKSISPRKKKEMPGAMVIFLKENPESGWNELSISYAEELFEKEHMEHFADLIFKAVDFLEGRS